MALSQPVTLLPDQQLSLSGTSHEVIDAEHEKVWLHDVQTSTSLDDRVVQTRHVGDLRAIFEAFHEQWQIRWCRQDTVNVWVLPAE